MMHISINNFGLSWRRSAGNMDQHDYGWMEITFYIGSICTVVSSWIVMAKNGYVKIQCRNIKKL